MISNYNRNQLLLGALNLLAAAIATALAGLFFYAVAWFVLTSFRVEQYHFISLAFAAGGLLVVFVSGFNLLRKGKGNYGYHESDLMPQWEMVSGGSYMVDYYRNRITAPAHALNQIFLCAPLQLSKGVGRFRSLVTHDQALEIRLEALLAEIEQKDKWETLDDYPGQVSDLGYLIRMDKIQFSPRTGKIRSLKR